MKKLISKILRMNPFLFALLRWLAFRSEFELEQPENFMDWYKSSYENFPWLPKYQLYSFVIYADVMNRTEDRIYEKNPRLFLLFKAGELTEDQKEEFTELFKEVLTEMENEL